MVDHRVLQRGVALLQCGQEQGTATVVAPTIAIAARHSIIDHLEDPGVRIELQLHDPDTVIVATLHPVTIPEEEDIVFLRLANPVEEFSTIQLSATHLPVGEEWQAFGFPSSRRAGAWIDGTVATWLPQGVHPQDVELSVNNFQALRSYRGYSGGPVWVAGKAVAFLQRQLSGGLASTSVLRLRRHLDAAGVAYRSAPNARRAPASLRPIIENVRPNTQTHWALENALRLADRGYTILSGPPGSGKTIIAAAFIAADPRTRIAAAYFAGGDGDSARLPPEYHRDPSAFAVWLANETALVSGRSAPSRSTDGIKEHAASVQQNLVALGEYFHGRSETGVLIVDDFCGPRAGDVDATLSRVFPATPPTGLAIVLTAASEAYVRTAAPHLRIASVVEVTPLEPYDCERIVAAQLGSAVQSTDVLRIASASNGNPLILSYLIREAKSALAAGLSLPDTGSAVPTAQAFYEQQWSRLSGNDASVWLLAFIARLRGRMEEAELSVVLPESVQAGLPTAWRMAGHLLRRESDGIEPFHSSFRPFVLAQTASLEQTIQDRFAEHCAPQASDYATANVIYHHLRGSPAKQATAAALCTQTWLDVCAARFTPPAYVLADIDDLLRLALTSGSLVQTVRLLFARSRVRFRYGPIFGKYGYELACVVNSLRSADAALGFVVHDNQLLCAPYEAVELIRRFILAEEHEIALDVYHALRRQCFAHYETGQVTPIASHLEALGLLSGQLGEKSLGELRALYRLLDRAVGTDGADDATFKVRARALPAAAFLWQWGWFVHSIRLRESDPVRYATELASVLDHAHSITRFYGVTGFKLQPPPPTDLFKIFTADDAAAEIELACRGRRLNESVGRYTIDVLMRHGRDPQVVSELANALTWPATIQVRDTNDVDMDKTALDTLFLRNAIGSYLREPAFLHAPSTREVGPWEKRFLDAFSWLGATYGRLCRARRDAAPETLDTAAFLRILTFTLSDRSLWEDSYALPEAMFPLLMSRLCSLLREFAPHLAPIVSSWAIDQPDNQLGLYTEGYRAALWELAEGLSLCDKSAGRAVWRAYFANTVACAQNREERVPSLLACAQGASYFGDPELAEEALAHALKASMGPSWYKEDQFTLLVDALTAASQGTLTRDRWRDVVSLLEHASGDVTFQRFVRYEKASLVRHLGKSGRIVDALALVTNYLWPDQRTQLGRIRSWRADRVTSIDGGRWGVLEIERQAGALALLSGVADAPPRYRWAVIELFLPGDDRHFASFAKLLPSLFEAAEAEEIKSRLLRLLVADFVPEMRERFVGELRLLNDQRMNEWLQSVELEYDWAKQPVEADSVEPIAPPSRAISESAAERSPDDLFAPGLFGRQSGNDALEEAIATANARRDIGDLAGARDKFIEGLTAAQAAGWDIWGQNSKSRMALRSLFEIGSSSSAIQALRGVVLAEEYAVDWRVAGALVDAAVPKQETAVREEVVEAAFEHVATILAPETGSDVGYELRSLQAGRDLESSAQAIIMFLLSSLDDACCHFRDRAATALRWLLVSQPDFDIKTLLSHGIRRVGGHSRELCLGLLHSWFVERPDAARAALTALPDFWALLADPSFAVRYVATVVQESHPVGTSVSSVEMSPIDLGGEASQPTATAPEWQSWRDDCSEILRLANDEKSFQRAARHLSSLCGEFEPSQVVGLWRIRREAAQSKDFWSSPHEREAAWRAMGTMSDRDVAGLVDQFMWNPQWPDAALDLNREGVCDMIFGRIRDREFDDCFMVEGQLLLHAREASFDDKHQAASGLEIVAFLVPSVYFTSEFGDELLFERLSCHGPAVARPSIIATPIEPAVARFSDRRGCVGGSMTPAQPSRRFLELSRATPKAFQRASWRQGREWEPLGVGRPLRDGTILTVDRGVSLQLTGMDLAWCLFRNGSRVALVHPARRMVFAGDDL